LTTEGYTGFTCDPVCYDEDNCDGGAPVGPEVGGYEFGSMQSADPVFHVDSRYDMFNDVGIFVTVQHN